MKEKLLVSNENFCSYRVSKKLRKKGRWAKTTCIDIKVTKKGIQILSSKYVGGIWSSKKLYFIGFGKSITVRRVGSPKISYSALTDIKTGISKYVSRKINRIVNKHFGVKFKISRHFCDNVAIAIAPAYDGVFSKPTYETLTLYKHGLKRGLKKLCGFSGNKFVREFSQLKEGEQYKCLAGIIRLKPYLSHGEHLSKITVLFPKRDYDRYDPLIKRNSRLFIDASQQGMANFYLLDTCRMVETIEERGIKTSFDKLTLNGLIAYHDKLSSYLSGESLKNVALPYYEDLECETVKCPRSYNELRSWASYMGNCIAGYKNAILQESAILLGIFSAGTLKYNVSLSRSKEDKPYISQFNSRFNQYRKENKTEEEEYYINLIKNRVKKISWSKLCSRLKMDESSIRQTELLEL